LTCDFAEETEEKKFETAFWGGWMMAHIDFLLGLGVVLSTAATDAVYVMFNAAVSSRRRLPAATWSSVWYLLFGIRGD
jgi:hypothetical protein